MGFLGGRAADARVVGVSVPGPGDCNRGGVGWFGRGSLQGVRELHERGFLGDEVNVDSACLGRTHGGSHGKVSHGTEEGLLRVNHGVGRRFERVYGRALAILVAWPI